MVTGTTADAPDTVKDITNKTEIKSSSAARLSADTTDRSMTLGSLTGEVTLTVTAGDFEEVLVLTLVDKARELSVENSTIGKTSLTVADTITETVDLVLKDQYGDAIEAVINADSIKNDDGKEIAMVAEQTADHNGELALEIVGAIAADAETLVGTYEVEEKTTGTKLGEIEVTAVKKPGAEEKVDYEVAVKSGEKATLDMNSNSLTTKLQVKKSSNGVGLGFVTLTSSKEDGFGWKVTSSDRDEDVVAVTDWTAGTDIVITAKGEGSAVITIEREIEAGAGLYKKVATFNIAVEDTRELITAVEFEDVLALEVVTAGVDIVDVLKTENITTNPEKEVTIDAGGKILVGTMEIGKLELHAGVGVTSEVIETSKIKATGNGTMIMTVLDKNGDIVNEVELTVKNS